MEYMSNTNAVVVTKAIVSSAYVTNVMMVLEVWFTWLNKISIFRRNLRYNTYIATSMIKVYPLMSITVFLKNNYGIDFPSYQYKLICELAP